MVTKTGGRINLKKIARYCAECGVWIFKRFWLSVWCPCCHKKMRDSLSNLVVTAEKRTTEMKRQWRIRNREKWNEYRRKWSKMNREKCNKYKRDCNNRKICIPNVINVTNKPKPIVLMA